MNLVTHTPLVSVLLPVRNGLPHLREAVASVLAQSLTDLELIVVDDDSRDGSALVARGFNDPRVRVIRGRGLGLAHALNLGLRAARGGIIARQDADDLSRVDRLERLAAFLESSPDVDVVSSRVGFVDHAGRETTTAWTQAVQQVWERAGTPEAIARLLPLTNCLVHGSVAARRSTLAVVGGYDETLDVAQDYDLWLRLLPSHCFARLSAPLYTYRLHAAQVSARKARAQTIASIAAKLRYIRRLAGLTRPARALLTGTGRGRALYEAALPLHGFHAVEAGSAWDVAIATSFDTLDDDLLMARRSCEVPVTHVGNFLLAWRQPAEAAA
ncbi:MAG: glycosyltransferase [Vicinamibacterales bacterium]